MLACSPVYSQDTLQNEYLSGAGIPQMLATRRAHQKNNATASEYDIDLRLGKNGTHCTYNDANSGIQYCNSTRTAQHKNTDNRECT